MSDTPRGNGSHEAGPRGREPTEREYDFAEILDFLKRQWLVILLCGLLGVVPPWWEQRDQIPRYRAEVLIRQEQETQPLAVMGLVRSRVDRFDLGSQLRVMQSRAVLAPVVDSVGLRLRFQRPGIRRSDLVSGFEVDPDYGSGEFQLLRDGAAIRLRDLSDESLVSSGSPGDWLFAPGFSLRIADEPRLDAPVKLVILEPEAALAQLRGSLTAEQVEETYLFRVSYASPDPELSAEVVNAVARAYQAYESDEARREGVRRREFLANQLASVSDSLALEQARLHEYQTETGVIDPRIDAEALTGRLSATQAELQKLRFEEQVMESALASIDEGSPPDEAFQRILAVQAPILPSAQTLGDRLQELRTERQGLTVSRFGYTDEQPEVERLDSLIAITRSEIRQAVAESLVLLRERRSALESRAEELQLEIRALPGRMGPYARQELRVAAVQRMLNRVADRYYEAQVTAEVPTGNVSIVGQAPVPRNPLPTQNHMGFGFLIGLAIGAGLGFLREHLDTTLRTADEVRAATGLEILAMIPRAPQPGNDGNRPMPVLANDFPSGLEAFRALRTMLRFTPAARAGVIGITSPDPAAGKTTVALNLAAAIAQEGGKVLLVDADLRRPVQHRIVGTSRTPGFTDVLVGEAELMDVIEPVEAAFPRAKNLWLLPAGTEAPNPTELLAMESFTKLVRAARDHFETVVIDTTPVLAVADATVVGSSIDAMLIVTSAAETHRSSLQETVSRLRHVGASIPGIVLNKVPEGSRYYGYRRSAYAGYYQNGSRDGTPEETGSRLRDLVKRGAQGRT